MIKIFMCGKCKTLGYTTRKGLRKHLRDKHLIKKEKTNYYDKKLGFINQPWWKWREFK